MQDSKLQIACQPLIVDRRARAPSLVSYQLFNCSKEYWDAREQHRDRLIIPAAGAAQVMIFHSFASSFRKWSKQ